MHSAEFRFYQELNDFLPPEKRRRTTVYRFTGNPSVKDAIEAQGVPHTEVDLVIVAPATSLGSGGGADAVSVDFTYQLKPGDRVAVYPVFESFDIASTSPLRPEPLRVIRFVADVHLGTLARLLRQMGFDTWYTNDQDDAEIAMRSKVQRRIVLTRDQGLLKRSIIEHGYWVRSQHAEEQACEVIRRFDLARLVKPFTRCARCNGELLSVPAESVQDEVPEKTWRAVSRYARCDSCGKLYWRGSHAPVIEARIRRILDAASQ